MANESLESRKMPVCGWVVRFSGAQEALAARAPLAAIPGASPGEAHGLSVPLVTESADAAEVYDVPERAMAIPGVVHVDLVFSDLSDVGQVPESTIRRGLRRRSSPHSLANGEVSS